MNALLKLRTLTALTAFTIVALAGGVASADTIQDIIDGGNSVTYGNLQFSDFSISNASNALSGVNAGNVDVTFSVAGGQVTLEFNPNASYGSDWEASFARGSFVVNYKVTGLAGNDVQATRLGLDEATGGDDAYAKVSSNMHRDAAKTDLVGQLIVQTGMEDTFGDEELTGYSSFNPTEPSLYVTSRISLLGLTETASLDQFSQSYTATPEPGTLGVMGIGGLGVILARRKARKNRRG